MRLRTIRAQVTAFFAAAVALSVAVAMLARSAHDRTVAALDEADRSQSLVLRLTQMGRHLAAMQASQRGYVITGSAAELGRYDTESRRFDDQFAAARKEMPDADGLQRLTRFGERIRDWRETSQRLIELRSAGRDVRDLIATQATPRFTAAQREFTVLEDEERLDNAAVAEDARRVVDVVQGAMTATAAVGALLGLMLLSAAQRRLIEPLATLAASARRLGRGDYAARLPERRSDEIGVLTEAFADMRAAVQERIDASRAANAELLAILDTVPAGIVLLDSSGALRLQNPMAAQFLGVPPEGDEESLAYWKGFSVWDAAGSPVRICDLAPVRALQGERVLGQKLTVQRPDGTRADILVAAAPVLNSKSEVGGAVAGFQDVSVLRELDRMKDEFVALASHQLRTPATAVKGNIGLLLEGYCGPLNAEQLDTLKDALDSNERQLKIIDDILWVARTDAGRLTLTLIPTNIGALVNAVVAEQRATIEKRRQSIEVRQNFATPLVLPLDSGKFRMVFENLLSNASKYTPEGGRIEVSLGAVGNRATVSIKDTGVGIAPEDIGRLFGKFSRIDNPLSTTVSGSGLGLYLANEIVRLHGGVVRVDSTPGLGSTFTVTLPREAGTT